MSLDPKQVTSDLFSDDTTQKNNAIVQLATKGIDPEFILERLTRIELIQGTGKLFKQFPQKYEDTMNTLGLTYRDRGFVDYALKIFQRLVDLGSGNPATLNNLGIVLYDLGHIDEAVKWLQKANEIDKKLSPETAAILPAARNLRGMEPQFKINKKFGSLFWAILAIVLVIVAFILGFASRTSLGLPLNLRAFLTALVQVDGFIFAFVGTFVVFVLREIRMPLRNSYISYVVVPILVYNSSSILSALVLILIRINSIFAIIPYILTFVGLVHAMLLVFYIRVVPFTPRGE